MPKTDEWSAMSNSVSEVSARHKPIAGLVREGIDIEDKNAHISVICVSGHRSNIAGSFLKAAGFENIYSVIGGMSAWRQLHRLQ